MQLPRPRERGLVPVPVRISAAGSLLRGVDTALGYKSGGEPP